jgi:hypothetical protein
MTRLCSENAVAKIYFHFRNGNLRPFPIKEDYYFKELLWTLSSKINNQWTFRNKIAGFDYSSKYFEIMNNLNVFVSHEYKGFIDLLDNKLTKTKPFITYNIQKR